MKVLYCLSLLGLPFAAGRADLPVPPSPKDQCECVYGYLAYHMPYENIAVTWGDCSDGECSQPTVPCEPVSGCHIEVEWTYDNSDFYNPPPEDGWLVWETDPNGKQRSFLLADPAHMELDFDTTCGTGYEWRIVGTYARLEVICTQCSGD